ncbi:hypothetical protein KG892_04980 [Vermiphilus pyriformis]|uniref:Uncharacterized protein n=1 Tax=candidate division TM6 bacterium JCVI TM6SC1 TaxID=1306947 RepID=A0A0D2JE26_9BACT|nr:hypothetical protein J120_02930 [candidate division TM6 bacterium JCVI TM6SC1]UNE35300.1 MAG: hypothetical protein KG892_04980 [Vermiphilus pyriformis]
MSIFSFVPPSVIHALYLFWWKDLIELTCIWWISYHICRWLAADRHKPLLIHVCLYITLMMISYWFMLPNLMFLSLVGSPLAAIIAATLHQRTLQKNFVLMRSTPQSCTPSLADWTEQCIKELLWAMGEIKNANIVIQKNDQLFDILKSPIMPYALLRPLVLYSFLESSLYESDKLIWINAQGTLLGINSQWNLAHEWTENSRDEQEHHLWLSHSLDAIFIHTHAQERTFTIYAAARSWRALTGPAALTLLRHLLQHKDLSLLSQGNFHEQIQNSLYGNTQQLNT